MARSELSPIRDSQWDARKARHLLNRAGFGVPKERMHRLNELGAARAVDSILGYASTPAEAHEPEFIMGPAEMFRTRRELRELPESERRRARNKINQQERQAIHRLKVWWLRRIYDSRRPLEEKMTLFWHGHFATSAQKVRSSYFNCDLNRTFRVHATGNFKALTLAVGQSPSMMQYLDTRRNVKGRPNENWARELMELFTMGRGRYSEQDIKESARAFTGWTLGRGEFAYNEGVHDFGEKTFLGTSGDHDGWDIIDLIFDQPETAEFIAGKLLRFFAHPTPDGKVVRDLGDELRANDYELAPTLRTLFSSRVFYSDESMGTQIKSPVQFLIQLATDMRLDPPPWNTLAQLSAQLGQDLFYPPNVKGWDGDRAWINANTLLTRYNAPTALTLADGAAEEAMLSSMEPDKNMMAQTYRSQIQPLLEEMPVGERRAFRAKMRNAQNRQERMAIANALLDRQDFGGSWDSNRLFSELTFETTRECVEALKAYLLVGPLSDEQTRLLAEALGVRGGMDARLQREDLSREGMNAALHLILSMAEYQLC